MSSAEGGRRWRAGAAAAVLVVAVAALVAHELALGRRIAALEAAVAERDAADPLVPKECLYAMRTRGETWGQTRERPCEVEFQRLIEAPQQFEGRWVKVQGAYADGFETSALSSPESQPQRFSANGIPMPPPSGYRHALWVSAPRTPDGTTDDGLERVVVVGRFHRGPAGHLGAYFGELANQ